MTILTVAVETRLRMAYKVVDLPSAVTATAGARTFVSDSSVTTFNTTVAGGGSNIVPVFSNGTNWKVG